jgi:hypothetical protein
MSTTTTQEDAEPPGRGPMTRAEAEAQLEQILAHAKATGRYRSALPDGRRVLLSARSEETLLLSCRPHESEPDRYSVGIQQVFKATPIDVSRQSLAWIDDAILRT